MFYINSSSLPPFATSPKFLAILPIGLFTSSPEYNFFVESFDLSISSFNDFSYVILAKSFLPVVLSSTLLIIAPPSFLLLPDFGVYNPGIADGGTIVDTFLEADSIFYFIDTDLRFLASPSIFSYIAALLLLHAIIIYVAMNENSNGSTSTAIEIAIPHPGTNFVNFKANFNICPIIPNPFPNILLVYPITHANAIFLNVFFTYAIDENIPPLPNRLFFTPDIHTLIFPYMFGIPTVAKLYIPIHRLFISEIPGIWIPNILTVFPSDGGI